MKTFCLMSFLTRTRCSNCLTAFFMLFVGNSVIAQDISTTYYTNKAATYCQEKQFEKAIMYSDSSIKCEEVSSAYTWYVRGFVFKEAYKSEILNSNNYRNLAIESLLKCKEMQGGTESYNPDAVLKYLATTCYNDALITANQAIDAQQTLSDKYFDQYTSLMAVVDPGYLKESAAAEYYMTKAQKLYSLWTENSCDFNLLNSSEIAYQTALKNEPSNCDCLYNLSITSYNRGLMQKKNQTSEEACKDKISANECFERSISWLNKTEVECPGRQDVCQALLNSHKALGNQNEIIKYTKSLEEIKQSKNSGR